MARFSRRAINTWSIRVPYCVWLSITLPEKKEKSVWMLQWVGCVVEKDSIAELIPHHQVFDKHNRQTVSRKVTNQLWHAMNDVG